MAISGVEIKSRTQLSGGCDECSREVGSGKGWFYSGVVSRFEGIPSYRKSQ